MHNVTTTPPKNITVLSAYLNASALGATTIVSGIAGRGIRVLGLAVVTTLANNVKLLSNATDITATFPLGANGGMVLPYNEHGWCQTADGEPLRINLSVATATGIQVEYIAL